MVAAATPRFVLAASAPPSEDEDDDDDDPFEGLTPDEIVQLKESVERE